MNAVTSMSASCRNWLVRCGVLAGPLFVAIFTAHGATLPGYRARRHPVSSLALGTRGWIQKANFLVAGCLYGAFAVGLWRFLALPAGAAVYMRSFAREGRFGWALYSGGTAATMLTAYGLASAAFNQAPALAADGGFTNEPPS
jgi:hypothetical protein